MRQASPVPPGHPSDETWSYDPPSFGDAECVPPAEHWRRVPEMPLASLELLPDELPQHACLSGRQVALLVLRVRVEHVKRTFRGRPVIDDPKTAPLARACFGPPH